MDCRTDGALDLNTQVLHSILHKVNLVNVEDVLLNYSNETTQKQLKKVTSEMVEDEMVFGVPFYRVLKGQEC
eukprot:CAMPEP_0116897020 /NCGR_PEP_ID=MMETSP0467-20121206/6124_1 /TAXON_ID=283647 /ORGANISM="Mesodinium pulex, Strain SPMC105" /LENGTH=71 /DNA_ID=CAMNT_0004568493 /DNA_START=377 /DNA_END=592 /DNA_ORIENTATION=-